MASIRLEETIKNALKGQYWGKNKVVVETDCSGNVDVYEFDEESNVEKITDLEDEIEELKEENGELEEQINILQEKLEEVEGY